ncbi:MAG: ATP-binding protein [Bacteroidales bacterium]
MNKKPFIFGIATFGENFTDRVNETARLKNNFIYGINSVLISPRRWGKTSLVKKVCDISNSERLKTVYIDIFSCRNEKEFIDTYATAILKQTSTKFDEFIDSAKKFITNLTPVFHIGTDPMNDYSLSLEWRGKSTNIDEILQLPEMIAISKGIKIVVCIDEFQQIAEFNDSKTFQKKLRTVWQLQQNVSYCIFGSKKHLMNELFEKRSLPFYKFGDSIYLPKISTPDWIAYICERFKSTGKDISTTLAGRVALSVENHSSYVQQLAWLLWIYSDCEATEENLSDAFKDLIDQNSLLFEKQTENLSSYQMNFLRAITDGVTSEFSSQEIIQRYKLGTSANVTVIKKALLKKELIDIENKQVTISDPVMKLWLKQRYFR